MKKALLAALAIGALTAGLAGSAFAAEDSWVLRINPGSGGNWWSPNDRGTTVQVRTTTTAGIIDDPATKDSLDGSAPPPFQGSPVVAAWYRPQWSTGVGDNPALPWAFQNDVRQPLTTVSNLVKTWDDLIVFALPGYSSPEIKLFFTTPTAAANLVPNSIGGKPVYYKLVLTYAPAGYAGPTSWDLSSPSDPIVYSNAQSSQYFIHEVTLPSAGAVGSNPISGTGPLQAEQTFGYRFTIITPEPGSMIVMASGLAGLVGLVSRRRKA